MGTLKSAVISRKTIVVWENLSDYQAKEVCDKLLDIMKLYQRYTTGLSPEEKSRISAPISYENKKYILPMYKHGVFVLNTAKNEDGKYIGSPILNGDELYEHLSALNNAEVIIQNRIKTLERMPEYVWTNLEFSNILRTFVLSPNPNPEDFVKSLNSDNLSQMYKNFLTDVGISLKTAERINLIENDCDLDR